MKDQSAPVASVQLRLRVLAGKDIALGPGKVELLRRVQETHSISAAARQMKMSYMRAWTLIQTMNRCFHKPVILAKRGGKERGGAFLTETGEQVLALYAQLETESLAATKTTRKTIISLLKAAA